MDSLQSLLEKGEYETIIKLTKNAKDSNSLFYRIVTFLMMAKGEEALEVIKNNRKILEQDLEHLIKVHIDTLCILEKFDEAFQEYEYYRNLPYESQKIEELIADIPTKIKEEMKNFYKGDKYSDEDLIAALQKDEMDNVIAALDMVKNREIKPFIPYLERLMLNYPKQSIRSFALLTLVEKKVNESVKFKHIDEFIDVNPSELTPPFIDEKFSNIVKEIETTFKDPVLSENAIQIYSSYIIYHYPFFDDYDEKSLISALKYVGMKYLQMDYSTLKITKKVEKIIVELIATLEDF